MRCQTPSIEGQPPVVVVLFFYRNSALSNADYLDHVFLDNKELSWQVDWKTCRILALHGLEFDTLNLQH